MKYYLLLAAVFLGCTKNQTQSATPNEQEPRLLETARAILGLPGAPATLSPVDDVYLPMLRSSLGNGPFWKVNVSYALRVEISPPVDGFEVYFTKEGQPFSVRTTPVIRDWVPAALYEESLKSSDLRFTGLTHITPKPLVPILEGGLFNGLGTGQPGRQQIEAFLVKMAPNSYRKVEDNWVVRFRGSDLMICPPPSPDGKDPGCTTHPTAWESLVDAKTGELSGRSNSPD